MRAATCYNGASSLLGSPSMSICTRAKLRLGAVALYAVGLGWLLMATMSQSIAHEGARCPPIGVEHETERAKAP